MTKVFCLNNRNYHTLRTMHVRGDEAPNKLSRRPLTAAQEGKEFIEENLFKNKF